MFSRLQADIENTGRPGYTTLENIESDVVCQNMHHHRVNKAQSVKTPACHKTRQSLTRMRRCICARVHYNSVPTHDREYISTKILRGLVCMSHEAPRTPASNFFDNNSLLVHIFTAACGVIKPASL